MHIGFLTADLTHSHGWAHYSTAIVNAVRDAGVRVTVVAAKNSPDGIRLLPSVTPAARFQLMKMLLALPATRAALADCDLLHATAEPYAPLAWAASAGRPYIITAHGTYARPGWNRAAPVRALHRHSFQKAARIVAVSNYTADVVRGAVPGVQVTTVNNGIDPHAFADLPAPSEPDPAKRRPTILTVGGVKKRKGTPQLVHAVAQIHETLPDVRCVIVGNTDAEPDTTALVRALIRQYDLSENVSLVGFISQTELLSWYAEAHVFALPSINDGYKFEGFGLVHLEASAAGLPVVGTDNCGAVDAIRHGETGLLVPQAEVDTALADALLTFLTDTAYAARVGEAGRHWAKSQTWNATAQNLIALYEDLLTT